MRRAERAALAAALAITALAALALTAANADPRPPRDRYTMKVEFFERNLTVVGHLLLEHVNRHPVEFRQLYFHIYPNAFRARGGGINVTSVSDDEGPLPHAVEGVDGTLLRVALRRPLRPGGALRLKISFVVKVPRCQDRFGYWGGVLALGNWYPILAVYDEEGGWHLDPYFWHGESFHFYFADYDLWVEVDEGFVLASTGVLVETRRLGGGRVLMHWVATNVREVAMAGSRRYRVVSTELWGIKIYSYFLPEHERQGLFALEVARAAIRVYSEHFGRYPYPEFRVCETYGWFGGMEYPMIIFITSRLYRPGARGSLEIVVAHEVAHQWWYATLANDEANEPWLDEAFAEYSQILYVEWVHGRERARSAFDAWIRGPYVRYLSRREDAPAALSVWNYSSPYEYYNAVYNKGAYVLHMLRLLMGDEKFFRLLRTWYERYRFRFARIRDFIRVAEEVYGGDLSWFFNAWLFSSGVPEYKVLSAEASPHLSGHVVRVVVAQVGGGGIRPAAVPVVVVTAEGEYEFRVLVNGTGVLRAVVPGLPRWVVIDPAHEVLRLGNVERAPVTVVAEEAESLLPYALLAAAYAALAAPLARALRMRA